jgi:cytochrome c peroxidase
MRLAASEYLLCAMLLSGAGGCNETPASNATPASSSAPPDAAPPDAGRSAPPRALDDFAKIPVKAAAKAREALAAAGASADPQSPAYLAFRRAVACGEPFFRDRGFMTEALFGGGPADEIGGPLGRLDAAMTAGDKNGISSHGADVGRALRLLEDSFERTPASRAAAAALLPRAAFTLGAIIAGAKPGLSSVEAGVIADAQGLLDFIESGAAAYGALVSPSQKYAAAAAEATSHMAALRKAFNEAAGEIKDRARLVVTTGRLGAALRAMVGPRPWKPYAPRIASGADEAAEPLSVLTVPALRRISLHRNEHAPTRLADLGDVELGKKLFFDKGLSQGGVRSCATCHSPDKGYSDGKPHPRSLDPATVLLRNSPTLLYSSLHAAQFWDGRALTAEQQATTVIHSRAEMGNAKSPFPRALVANAEAAAAALAAFEAWYLTPASSPLDRFARGEDKALSAEERAGFDVFAGKGRCSRCHVPPLFGGSHPPDFSTPIYAALGVPSSPAAKALDPDPGREGVTHRPRDRGAFKTPTVRNAASTAPYFHNGAFPTLESVVDFYDKGGGEGLGLTVPNQDPEVRPLKLTVAEKRALLRFLRESLADASSSPAR